MAFAAVADLAVLPMSFLARGFPLEDLGAGFYWAFIVAGALVVAIGLTLLARRGWPGRGWRWPRCWRSCWPCRCST